MVDFATFYPVFKLAECSADWPKLSAEYIRPIWPKISAEYSVSVSTSVRGLTNMLSVAIGQFLSHNIWKISLFRDCNGMQHTKYALNYEQIITFMYFEIFWRCFEKKGDEIIITSL